MRKFDILATITQAGIVAVVRAETPAKAEKIARAVMDGGIKTVEITFTVPAAHKVIEGLREKISSDDLLLGAGTVLDAETARAAILAGAEYIVSPHFDAETCRLCNRYQLPYMPGCMTIREMMTAMEAGVDIIKLFPGSHFGPSFVKAVKGPLPKVNLMPTGGVSLDNVADWIKNGSVAVGTGGQLTQGAKTDDYALVTRTAREFISRIKTARA